MLKDVEVLANVAVSDRAKAKEFYSDKLGLNLADESMAGLTYQCGPGKLFVYESANSAGKGEATCATWTVTDLEPIVNDLKSKGVEFNHFEMPQGEWQGDMLVMGGMKAAWMKDPDGNTLGLVQMA